ncbi:O-methyltransferase [Flagellimonas meridianipacifica]|uniref:Putative O-methyltransferase YrrM n=1 Tax=Flagellimonas meridianipacifica TaxID=1080225 RepID=A0A2T0M6G9_9FLAO|nr:O-methyltransferase [Allomuricauda pacifica]PRX53053.1 putative O-methyltransferase YrrM [Allomuricauda pacifica]
MHFLSPILESYIAKSSEEEPPLLKELTRETHLKVVRPRMLTGHFQGRVLSILSKIIAPKHILEIGTYTGYSAICLSEGLQKDGTLHTIEVNEELFDIQTKYFEKSGFSNQIVQHIGDALEIIPKLEVTFDLVFIDAHKVDYHAYFESALKKTKSGSIILSDNVLWSGKVVEPLDKTDLATAALLEYNEKLKNDPRVETVLLPIRDGLTLCRVK